MPLYLDELWLEWSDGESARRVLTTISTMGTGAFPFPEGVRLVAGPWFSNEERKIIMILDIRDHATTFPSFGLAMVHNLIGRRRLTPIVEWSALQELLGTLGK
jgi:inactivated superfamily I helicase